MNCLKLFCNRNFWVKMFSGIGIVSLVVLSLTYTSTPAPSIPVSVPQMILHGEEPVQIRIPYQSPPQNKRCVILYYTMFYRWVWHPREVLKNQVSLNKTPVVKVGLLFILPFEMCPANFSLW